MVSGATLLLAALVSNPGAPVSTYEQPVCGDAHAPDAAAELPPADEPVEVDPVDPPLTPAVNCSEPPPLPPVVDCNDARMSIWVQEMIGSCDMPRTGAALKAPRPDRPSATCDGQACSRDRVPMRAITRSDDNSQPFATLALQLGLAPSASRLTSRAEACPRSAPLGRLERPPRV